MIKSPVKPSRKTQENAKAPAVRQTPNRRNKKIMNYKDAANSDDEELLDDDDDDTNNEEANGRGVRRTRSAQEKEISNNKVVEIAEELGDDGDDYDNIDINKISIATKEEDIPPAFLGKFKSDDTKRPKKGDIMKVFDLTHEKWINVTVVSLRKRQRGKRLYPVTVALNPPRSSSDNNDKKEIEIRKGIFDFSDYGKRFDAFHDGVTCILFRVYQRQQRKLPAKPLFPSSPSAVLTDRQSLEPQKKRLMNPSVEYTHLEYPLPQPEPEEEDNNESVDDSSNNNEQEKPEERSEDFSLKTFESKPFESKVQDLLSLVMGQSRGESNNDSIEDALSSLLQRHISSSPTKDPQKLHVNHTSSSSKEQSSPAVKRNTNITASRKQLDMDEDDYDDISDTQEDEESGRVNDNTSCSTGIPKWTGKRTTIESLKKQSAIATEAALKKKQSEADSILLDMTKGWKKLQDIPLGKEGARMMITFGDGRNPHPATVALVLLIARKCLHHAIKDARALRRKMKEEYKRAKLAMSIHSSKKRDIADFFADMKKGVNKELNPVMCYRALGGYDPLSYDPKCGFEVAQLEVLFPEEMQEYKKWAKMHKEYKKNDQSDKALGKNQGKEDDDEDNEDQAQKKKETEEDDDEEGVGGHMRSRLAQFDIRTDVMKDQWYIAFSEVRKGSFLPKNTSSVEERKWNRQRREIKENKHKRKPRHRPQKWENLPACVVQFLHWLGFFNQRNALPVPNMDVTEALAFLGYDFVGKIVEKAIFLRYLDQENKLKHSTKIRKRQDNANNVILELGRKEQLNVEDILRAYHDTTLNTSSLYSTSHSVLYEETSSGKNTRGQNNKAKSQPIKTTDNTYGAASQLYFGPGFEERLELELDQIIYENSSHKNKRRKIEPISDKEKQIRIKEDELFSDLAKAPTLLQGNFSDFLNRVDDDKNEKKTTTEKKNTVSDREIMSENDSDNYDDDDDEDDEDYDVKVHR
eukprot:CAMPEP_0178955632 /NCGR_PEP_ID=MMETSP0789-20121207/9722_1 /TAXON_ID=3005 /ORGANISM="Rhizosolenia setigera, Strain CCMP 1694" /LENGTH=975 /DNA_ID=CAMNT_0020637303 /DNA_START=74 /DNA_END=3001 /DNA_ORIENTATION=+